MQTLCLQATVWNSCLLQNLKNKKMSTFTKKYICFYNLFKVKGDVKQRKITEGEREGEQVKNH